MELRGALQLIALGLVGYSVCLLLPVLFSLYLGDFEHAFDFLIYLMISGFVGCAALLALRGSQLRLSHINSFTLILIIWVLFGALATASLSGLLNLTWSHAIFEAVSGLTTSGGSVLATKEAVPLPVLMWRSQLEWMGGFLTIVTVVLVIAPTGAGGLPQQGLPIYSPNAQNAAQVVFKLIMKLAFVYLAITLVGFCFIFGTGADLRNAINLSMMGVATGGFRIADIPLDETVGIAGLGVLSILLMMGAANIFWLAAIWRGDKAEISRYREPFIMLGLVFTIALLIGFQLFRAGADDIGVRFFLEPLFNAASLIATSGVESRPGVFALLSIPTLLFLVLFGGCSFSTAGGLKIFRLGAMTTQCIRELNKLIYPNMVQNRRFGQGLLNPNMVNAVWSYFIIAIVSVFLGAVALSWSDLTFAQAITASVSFFSNCAPFYQAADFQTSQASANFGEFSDVALIFGAILMLLGRLEVILVLSAITHFIRR